MPARPCLDILGGGAVLVRSLASLWKTAFLAYARAFARVRGRPNITRGLKADAPKTATSTSMALIMDDC